MISAQVAFSKDFMESYSRLPRKVQKKVREFTEKFQKDPTQPGINFERLKMARSTIGEHLHNAEATMIRWLVEQE